MIKLKHTVRNTERFLHNLNTNIKRSQTRLAEVITHETHEMVELNAPVWRGTLRSKISMKIFPRSHRGEVFMSSWLYNKIAMQNEYNIDGKRKLYKTAYPKLAEWAEDKGVFKGLPYVIVGGAHTRLGRENKFFLPAFIWVNAKVPSLTEQVTAEAVLKTRS